MVPIESRGVKKIRTTKISFYLFWPYVCCIEATVTSAVYDLDEIDLWLDKQRFRSIGDEL